MASPAAESSSHEEEPRVSVQKIQELLRTKDDTTRFVGLALLKSILDNSTTLREDEPSILALWESVSPRFLDRLLRTASGPKASRKDGKDMLDIAVAVLHTFASLLPEEAKREPKLVGRIPFLTASILHSSEETTNLILQTLLTLVSFPEGACVLVQVEDVSPMVEIAPSHSLVLDIFSFAWPGAMAALEDKSVLATQVGRTIQGLVSAFKGTDAVTLLNFLAAQLRSLDREVIPRDPPWIGPLIVFIRNLVSSKPTPMGRAAYTNVAATLLQVFPAQAPQLLFAGDSNAEKPFSYLLINLLLIDLRACFPSLLEQLNSPEYAETSKRLASAFDVISSFVGYLVRSIDDDDDSFGDRSTPFSMPPDLLLKLRKAISETMSAAMEHLRDRWDASVAGAMGLHPDARAGTAATAFGTRLTLAWDSKHDSVADDPFVLAALRALAVWLREDDNETLRREATGLCDMLVELYRGSAAEKLDFRWPVLVALEGITVAEDGVECLLNQDGWQALSQDMLEILQASSRVNDEDGASRGIEIVRILLPIAENEQPASREDWMNVVTSVAAWDVPGVEQPATVQDFQSAVLQLVTALLVNSPPGVRRRYVHSMSAIVGIASRLRQRTGQTESSRESLDDVIETLGTLR